MKGSNLSPFLGKWMEPMTNNPKHRFGAKKAALSAIPCPVLLEVGLGMAEGAYKYGRHNYRDTKVVASIYYDATVRHLMAWWEGEDIDAESGCNLSHVTKAICSLVVLRDAMMQNNIEDDRPIRPQLDWMVDMNHKAEVLYKKYPEPVAPFTQRGRSDAGHAAGTDEPAEGEG